MIVHNFPELLLCAARPRRYQSNSFPGFWRAAIGEDARGSSSKGVPVHPPLVLEATVCRYSRTRYVARAVRQRLLASVMRTKDVEDVVEQKAPSIFYVLSLLVRGMYFIIPYTPTFLRLLGC